jgi:hypothetical protein
MSAATTASSVVARSSSRRQSSYGPPSADRHQRTPSGNVRSPTTPGEAQSPDAYSQSQRSPLTASQQHSLAGVAQRDYEDSNLPKASSSRRERPREGPPPSYDNVENRANGHRSNSRPGPPRRSTDVPRTPSSALPTPTSARPRADPRAEGVLRQDLPPVRRRTAIDTQTGTWQLGKTIGAGSMGKVKLAKNNATGEQVRALLHSWISFTKFGITGCH